MLSWMLNGIGSLISIPQSLQITPPAQARQANTLLCQARLDVPDSRILETIEVLACKVRERLLFAYVRVFVIEVPDGQEQHVTNELKKSECFELIQANYFLSK